MSGYFALQVEWATEDAMRTYVQMLGKMVEKHGGGIVVASRDYRVVEGSWNKGLFMVIRFPSMDALRGWYESPEYQPVREFRLQNSHSDAVIFEGH